MTDVLLTFHCAVDDAEPVVEAIRARVRVPVHSLEESVYGRDFEDAVTAERVTGTLRRMAIALRLADAEVPEVVAAVDAARRRRPVRWHVVPVLASGRLA